MEYNRELRRDQLKRGDLVVFFVNQEGEYNSTSFHLTGSREKTFIGKITSGIVMSENEHASYTFCKVYTKSGTHYISIHDMCLAEEFLYGKKEK
jgi:hypothetical protein